MRFELALLLPSLAAALPASGIMPFKRADTWGGAVSLGPTKSTIVNAVTTFIPGAPPATQNGLLFLWPGMSNGTGDLVQTTVEQWNNGNSFGQLDGTASSISGDTKVRIEYNLMSDGTTWEQKVTDASTGKSLSYFKHDSGPYMRGYGTGTECDNSCTGTVSEQQYLGTTITLASADTSFGNTIGSSQGATYTGLKSSQGGKVWSIDKIHVPAM
ncbi:hypothetical protein BKCO1_1700040 [Neofusicoccum parvum]|uniref:Uncharacterized protein n=1 Tax=Neofusicoccum parvum TaxID=310453 RepID=A0ACB5SAI0_9PEZI|nr:hypothetical protein BKCO1_1700040 [Neofusicoccum parvum]